MLLNSSQNISATTEENKNNLVGLIPLKIILILLNIFFNGSVITIVLFLIKTKTFSNVLFAANALADLLVGLLSIPFMITYEAYGVWNLGKPLCLFWIIIDFTTASISVYTYLTIAIHRYMQIKFPYKRNENMSLKKYMVIISIWVLCLMFWMLPVVIITQNNFDETGCFFIYTFSYVINADIFGYFLPVLASGIINMLIFYEIRKKTISKNKLKNQNHRAKGKSLKVSKSNKVSTIETDNGAHDNSIEEEISTKNNLQQPQKQQQHHNSKEFIEKETKALICLCVVTGALCVLYSVFCIAWPIKAYCDECINVIIIEISYWLGYIYSTLNPFLLIIFHEKFRSEFKNFFKCFKNSQLL